jgi:hypothetical protein
VPDRDPLNGALRRRIDPNDCIAAAVDQPDAAVSGIDALWRERQANTCDDSLGPCVDSPE